MVYPVSQHELLGRIINVLFQGSVIIPAWKCWIFVILNCWTWQGQTWSVLLVQFALAREDRTLAMNTCTKLPFKCIWPLS